MKSILFSLVATLVLMFGFYWAVSQGYLHFPFDKDCLMEMGMEKEKAKLVFKKKTVNFSELGFFDTIHYYVQGGLRGLAKVAGFSHKTIYTLLYLLLLPLMWLFSLDRKTDFHWFKIGYLAILAAAYLLIKKGPTEFAESIYDKGEGFLQSISSMGIPYAIVSVFFCLLLPILMFPIVSMFLNKKVVTSY